MTPTCPNCDTKTRQTRRDGRCIGCGQKLPDELRTPTGTVPWLSNDLSTIPIYQPEPRSPLKSNSLGQRDISLKAIIAEGRPTPKSEVEQAVPWPVPLRPNYPFFTFWGYGSQITQPFKIVGDAGLRITVERGVLTLRVLYLDGSQLGNESILPGPGLALDTIPIGGEFVFEILAEARWGITVIHQPTVAQQPTTPQTSRPTTSLFAYLPPPPQAGLVAILEILVNT